MYEVELKVRADHGAVRAALDERGADPQGTVEQVDTYFDAPHREFAETDEALRVRRESSADGTVARVTYKGPLVEAESKTREEVETGVDDADDAEAVFEALGFEPAATVEKTRARFRLDGYTVTLDDVAGVGEFVEVETHAETVAPAREGARSLLSELGLDPDDHVRTSYLGMVLEADGG